MPRHRAANASSQAAEGQIEQRRGAHSGDRVAPGQAVALAPRTNPAESHRLVGQLRDRQAQSGSSSPGLWPNPAWRRGQCRAAPGHGRHRASAARPGCAAPGSAGSSRRRSLGRAGAARRRPRPRSARRERRCVPRGRRVRAAQAGRRRTGSPGMPAQAGKLGRERPRGIAPVRQAKLRGAPRSASARAARARSSPGAARSRAPEDRRAVPKGRHRLARYRDRPRAGRHQRQAVGKRFGEHHAVALVVRGQANTSARS